MKTYESPAHENRDEKIELYRSRTTARVLNDTFALIRVDFRLFVRALFSLSFAPMAVGLAMVGYGYVRLFSMLSGFGDVDFVGDGFSPPADIGILSLLFIVGASMLWLGGSLLLLVVHELVGMHRELDREEMRRATVRDVWERIKGRIFWMLGSTFVWFLGLMIISFALGLIPIVGLFAFYVVTVYTIFYFPLRIYEERGMGQSFIVSSSLVSGAWWRTLGFLILVTLLSLVLVGVLGAPLALGMIGSGTGLFELRDLADSSAVTVLGVLYALLYATAYYVTTAISTVAIIVYYYTRSEETLGRSLEGMIDTIGEKSPERQRIGMEV